ncbi:Vps25 [Trypoxylus dichotomus]
MKGMEFGPQLDEASVVEDLPFCKSITESAKAQDLFEMFDKFVIENVNWEKYIGMCTDAARSMGACRRLFAALEDITLIYRDQCQSNCLLQPHNETRSKQIVAWRSLILDYFKATKQSTLDIYEATNLPVFNNTMINRKLNPQALLTILNELQNSGNAAPIDKQKNIWDIYWHTLDEWANIVYNYITNIGATNSVLTIYELTQGDDHQGEEFYGLDSNVFIKILKTLETQGKCELMLFDDQQGVKFF